MVVEDAIDHGLLEVSCDADTDARESKLWFSRMGKLLRAQAGQTLPELVPTLPATQTRKDVRRSAMTIASTRGLMAMRKSQNTTDSPKDGAGRGGDGGGGGGRGASHDSRSFQSGNRSMSQRDTGQGEDPQPAAGKNSLFAREAVRGTVIKDFID